MGETTFRLRVWTRYSEPVAAVWAHKTTPARLAAELRPWAALRLSQGDQQTLQAAVLEGHSAAVGAWLVPPGIRWPLQLVSSVPGECFEDHSENVLFSRFEHRHVFQPTDEGCRYIDDVIFTPRGPSAKLVALSTKWLFVHRHRVAARHLQPDRKTVGTAVLRVLIEEEG